MDEGFHNVLSAICSETWIWCRYYIKCAVQSVMKASTMWRCTIGSV